MSIHRGGGSKSWNVIMTGPINWYCFKSQTVRDIYCSSSAQHLEPGHNLIVGEIVY